MSPADEDQDPLVQSLRARTEAMSDQAFPISGFVLPPEMGSLFQRLQNELARAPPSVAHLVPLSAKGRSWLQLFTSSLLGDVQEGLCASHFHVQQLESLERRLVVLGLDNAPALQVKPSGCVSGGNTRRLNFEYQAGYFAMRRTLEYLGVSAAAYFRADCHSIKDLGRVLAGKNPRETRERILDIVSGLRAFLPGLVPEDKGTNRSVRDKLAHWESVSAGTLNVSRLGNADHIVAELVGGGENLFSWSKSRRVELTHANGRGILMLGPAMRHQLSCLDDLATSFAQSLCPELGATRSSFGT